MKKAFVLVVALICGGLLGRGPALCETFNEIDNRKTGAWIISALGKLDEADVGDLRALKGVLSRHLPLTEVDSAFAKLQACRTVEKYKNNPLPLVAAEHYAFMRYEASKYGDTELRRLPKLYYDKKTELIKQGKEDRLKTTDLPVSPPSMGAVEWANLGVEHGLADYKDRENREPAKGSEADTLVAQMNIASSSSFFAWIGRTFGNTYTRTGNENCRVSEPSVN